MSKFDINIHNDKAIETRQFGHCAKIWRQEPATGEFALRTPQCPRCGNEYCAKIIFVS
jgi:hypothetical protein